MGNPMEKIDMEYEYIIVGAGPAGLQASYFLQKSGRSYAILEAGDCPAYNFATYPRHRTLISINKKHNHFPEADYNLRHDWNSLISDDDDFRFTQYSDELFPPADLLVKYSADYAQKYNLKIVYNTRVANIKKEKQGDSDEAFVLRTEAGKVYRAQVVIMACGAMKEKVPNLPGMELCQTYAKHSLNQADYVNKKVCIIGGGNSGFETADHLAGHAAIVNVHNDSPFKLAWDTHFPGHLRAINNNFIDMFHLKSIHGLRQAETKRVEEVFEDGKRKLKLYYDQPLGHWDPPCTAHLFDTYDEIILCTGWDYVLPDMFDDNCSPDTSPCGKYPLQTPTWESTNVKNMFFAGTCTQGRDRKAASSFIHGFRYSAAVLTHLLQFWRHNVPLPMQSFNTINIDEITKFMINRFSTTSALYQLNYGVLVDVMVLKPGFEKGSKTTEEGPEFEGTAQFYYELPSEWAVEEEMFKGEEHMWMALLKDHRTSFPSSMRATEFAVPPRLMDQDQPCQGFVQPVIRRYNYGQMVQEFAIGANFVVRPDQHQLSGDNNPVRAGNKLKNLMCKQLGIGGTAFDESMYSEEKAKVMFTPWTQEQIQEEQMKRSTDKSKACHFGQKPPTFKRMGQDLVLDNVDM